jgi:hypothetical protein
MENRTMKIAIAADAPNIDTTVAAHAARAPFYMIVDEDGHLRAAPANPLAAGGAQPDRRQRSSSPATASGWWVAHGDER